MEDEDKVYPELAASRRLKAALEVLDELAVSTDLTAADWDALARVRGLLAIRAMLAL